MPESNSPDDLMQLIAHLESLRRAGLMDLPRVTISSDSAGTEVRPALEEKSRASPEPLPGARASVAAPGPSSMPASIRETAGRNVESSHSQSASGGEYEAALPGMADIKPKPPAANRPKPTPPAKVATTPVSSFFDQSRVPFESPVVPPDRRPELLRVLAEEVAECTRCPHLAATRTQTVFQSGTPSARLMFIGEAPGADEDRLGEPFVGRAGQLLTDIVSKGMGLARSEIYIANVLKCRPPENRNPLPEEMANCRGFLDRQIEIVRPEFLCLLGKVAVGAILQTSVPMKTLRQRWHRYRDIPTIVTWHPAYLLRNPEAKKDTWEDIKMLMAEMGLKPPKA